MPSALESLISAAREHSSKLSAAAGGDASEYGMRATVAEADMLQLLADAAEAEMKNALPPREPRPLWRNGPYI